MCQNLPFSFYNLRKKRNCDLDVVVHVCNSSTQEAETEGLGVQGWSQPRENLWFKHAQKTPIFTIGQSRCELGKGMSDYGTVLEWKLLDRG